MSKNRTKWVSKQEIENCRANGRCIRCGKSEHTTANCRLLPLKHPETSMKATTVIEKELEDELEDDSLKDKSPNEVMFGGWKLEPAKQRPHRNIEIKKRQNM